MEGAYIIKKIIILLLIMTLLHGASYAVENKAFLPIPPIPGLEDDGNVSILLQIVFLLSFLTVLPAVIIMMTSFTRVLIVLSFLRTAMGTATMPPSSVLITFALALTFYIMSPVFSKINEQAVVPYINEDITFQVMVERSVDPMREFMLSNTRKKHLDMFLSIASLRPKTMDEVPLHIIVTSFMVSEIQTAFQIGFVLFLPFLVIDFVISSILLSMGMMMLPPIIISLPFKVMLFVLVDGWALLTSSLVRSFY